MDIVDQIRSGVHPNALAVLRVSLKDMTIDNIAAPQVNESASSVPLDTVLGNERQ